MSKITKELAEKVLTVVDKGLVNGLGVPTPGKMCVEAAVSFAMGEPHDDHPSCVDVQLADIKISLNDTNGWSSDKARARGLRRVAIAQLGSDGRFDDRKFEKLFAQASKAMAVQLEKERALAAIPKFLKGIKAAKDFDSLIDAVDGGQLTTFDQYDWDWVEPVSVAFYLKERHNQKGDVANSTVAEMVVQVLKKMKIPGTKYLYLTEKKAKPKAKAKKRR